MWAFKYRARGSELRKVALNSNAFLFLSFYRPVLSPTSTVRSTLAGPSLQPFICKLVLAPQMQFGHQEREAGRFGGRWNSRIGEEKALSLPGLGGPCCTSLSAPVRPLEETALLSVGDLAGWIHGKAHGGAMLGTECQFHEMRKEFWIWVVVMVAQHCKCI